VIVLAAGTAHADVLSLRLEAHGGGMGGAGVGGAQKDEAFFRDARGGAYGGLIGVEVLFVDVWVNHHQIRDQDGLAGTWTQFMFGLDLDFEMRDPPPQDFTADGKAKKTKKGKKQGKLKGYIELGLGFGFGVGTGQQIEPPLNNAQVSDKGFLVEGKFGIGFAAGKVLSFGVSVPIGLGYYFKNGFANDEDNHYSGLQGAVLLVMRGKIKLK
jgi:hypothetical protein